MLTFLEPAVAQAYRQAAQCSRIGMFRAAASGPSCMAGGASFCAFLRGCALHTLGEWVSLTGCSPVAGWSAAGHPRLTLEAGALPGPAAPGVPEQQLPLAII